VGLIFSAYLHFFRLFALISSQFRIKSAESLDILIFLDFFMQVSIFLLIRKSNLRESAGRKGTGPHLTD